MTSSATGCAPRRRWASCATSCSTARSTGSRRPRCSSASTRTSARWSTRTWRRCSSPSTTRRGSASGTRTPVIRRRCSGCRTAPIETARGGRSMPLCASDQAQYHEAERDLPAGSMLVLYTDGLIERRGESLDVGLDRLADVAAHRAGRGRGRRRPAARATSSPTTRRRTTSRCSASACRGRSRRCGSGSRPRPASSRGMRRAGRPTGSLASARRTRRPARSPSRSTRLPRTRSSTPTAWSTRTSSSKPISVGDVVEFVVRDFGHWRNRPSVAATAVAGSTWPGR